MAYTTIDDPSAHFQTTLWTGNATDDRSITNTGNSDLQPDFVWIKSRGTTNDHLLFDSTRGTGKYMRANGSDTETTNADTLQGFESDGIEIGADSRLNTNTDTVVSWQWKANGGTTTENDASETSVGSLDSVYQANTTAGFSIVTYTGNGTAATIAHGLGVKPECILIKNRGKDEGWAVYHGANTSAPETDGLHLNLTNATNDSTDYWNDVAPTTTTFGISSDDRSGGGYNYIAYVFNSIQGYSKFGSYTGNGDADGPFVYTGFELSYLIMKRTDSAGEWLIYDNKRDPFNLRDTRLEAQDNFADSTGTTKVFDFLSNGFKCRNSDTDINADGGTYVYMAFAEHPFVSSEGIPTTAV
jgi:hypothetical protein